MLETDGEWDFSSLHSSPPPDDDEEEGEEGEEGEEKMPSCGDYIMHFLTLPWKLIFAFIPPTGKNGIQYAVHSDSRSTRV